MPLIWDKHVAEPSTAEEINRSVGVTRTDAREVTRILAKLGYLKEQRGVGNSAKGKRKTTPPARRAEPVQVSKVEKARAKGTAGKLALEKAPVGKAARRGGTKGPKRSNKRPG